MTIARPFESEKRNLKSEVEIASPHLRWPELLPHPHDDPQRAQRATKIQHTVPYSIRFTHIHSSLNAEPARLRTNHSPPVWYPFVLAARSLGETIDYYTVDPFD
ncbi:hypothetical protein KC343_g70 [Hortaea werneckii]|nr:hypothetical protein KC317_g69 [Hortaea werneckii]KAI7638516.1 hypothetical protein KC343_g70 [Hortaea werneckii]